jgi:hypothetical protein
MALQILRCFFGRHDFRGWERSDEWSYCGIWYMTIERRCEWCEACETTRVLIHKPLADRP